MGILSLVTWLPLVGALVLAFLPKDDHRLAKIVAMSVAMATFGLSLGILLGFRPNTYHFQMVESKSWIEPLGISYSLGVDGISMWLVLLTTFLTIIALAYSLYVDTRAKTFMALILTLETAMVGSFLSLDLILFFTFFELTLLPMFFLVGIWGGERRGYAANKFLIYTFAGSIFMLVGMVALGLRYQGVTGTLSFNIVDIQQAVANGALWANAVQAQALIFWAFAIAFLIKTPSFPFHTWIPDTYAESPVAVPILSSVMVKMGTYGLLRFCLPLFPGAVQAQAPFLMALAVIGIVYGAIVAAVQPDMRRLVAYSSVSHMGFILLGIFSLTHTGLMGGAMQQINHGISTGALFLLIGFFAIRRGTTLFKEMGGLKSQMPVYAALFLIVMLSSVALPGTNGFVGEFLALMGAFEAGYAGAFGLNPIFAGIAGAGVVLAAVYLLYMFQQTFYGPNANPENRRLRDLKAWETAVAGVLVVLILWGGLFPNTFLRPMEASVQATRLMATNPVGQRPSWKDLSLEIDTAGAQEDHGALVRTSLRTQDQVGQPIQPTQVVAPANLHLKPSGSTHHASEEAVALNAPDH